MADNIIQRLFSTFFPQQIVSPLPDQQPEDPWIKKGWKKVGPNSYTWPTESPTPTPTEAPPQSLSKDIYQTIQQEFGNDSGAAIKVLQGENSRFDPNAYNWNPDDQSGDYGMMQINSKTLQDFLTRKPKTMERLGISSVEDLRDPVKNIKLAKVIYDEQGWNAWESVRKGRVKL